MDPILAMIFLFGGNFAPQGYAFCDGQLLAISSNTALFSLLGTTYGGNGINTFALPDLRGRVPVHTGDSGSGPGLSPYVLGQAGGTENVTLLQTQIPLHTHTLNVNKSASTTGTPTSNADYIAAGPSTGSGPNATVLKIFTNDTTAANIVPLIPTAIGGTGGSQPHSNLQPYLAVNCVIALQGIFPPRN